MTKKEKAAEASEVTNETTENQEVEETPEQTAARERAEKFNLENRYFIVKVSDAYYALSQADMDTLDRIGAKVKEYRNESEKPALEGIFVEKDWPEFNTVYSMLKYRVEQGEPITLERITASAHKQAREELNLESNEEAPSSLDLLRALQTMHSMAENLYRKQGEEDEKQENLIKECQGLIDAAVAAAQDGNEEDENTDSSA